MLTTLFLAAATPPPAAPAAGSDLAGQVLERMSALFAAYGLRALGALLFLLVSWIAAGWISRLILGGLERAKVDVTLAKFLSTLARWAVLVLAVVAILGIFGVQTASFAAVIGSAGLAVGLAMQGSLSNMAAGVMLMLFRPFRVGDVVKVAGQTGTVDEVELFSTHIDTADNRRVIIPNGQVFGSIIENITQHPVRRADIDVGVEYGADIDRTRSLLIEAARSVPGRATDREVDAFLKGFGPSSVDWQVQVWARKEDLGNVRYATLIAVKRALENNRIAIPYPQMVVTMAGRESAG